MAARTGMANLILRLRSMTQAGTADYSLAGTAYWDDNMLQDRLDRYARPLWDVDLTPNPQYRAGTTIYHEYQAPYGDLEEAASGTAYWAVTNSAGSVQGTANYSVDYLRGVIRFNADTGGSAYYLSGRAYDLHRTAMEIWREKQGSVAAYYSFNSDGQNFSRSDWFDHCERMIQQYNQATVIRRERDDTC